MMQRDLFTNRLPYIPGLGIPYMGSKRKLAPKIADFILAENPNAKYIFDLFGGGGAMSFEFLQRPQIERVVYNDLDSGVVSLLRDITQNGVAEKYLQWVDRATFHEHKNGDDWFAGFVKTCWSFGNNGDTYLFSEENERLKKPLHLAIVELDAKYITEVEAILGVKIPLDFLKVDNLQERRPALMSDIKRLKVGRIDLQQLERLQQLEQLQQLERLQQLEQLQQLERLQQLEQLQQLEISNASYSDVLINTPISETIIYLDPPYVNTASYQKELLHDELYSWIEKSPYKIYLSSYESHLPCVAEFEHRSTLSASNNSKRVLEKVFCNRLTK